MQTAMAGEDFVHVRLTAAGEQLAGKGSYVRICAGRCDFTFKVGETQRVTRAYESNKILRHEQHKGQPFFQIVPETESEVAATAPATAASPSAAAKPTVN